MEQWVNPPPGIGNYPGRVSPLGLCTLIVHQIKKSQTVKYAINNCLVCGIAISYQNNWKKLFIYNRVDGSGRFIKVIMHKFIIHAWVCSFKLVNFTSRSELCDNKTFYRNLVLGENVFLIIKLGSLHKFCTFVGIQCSRWGNLILR